MPGSGATEKVRVRGLAHVFAGLLGAWGFAVLLKALYDLSGGEPEANLYAPKPWAFVTREQWLRYARFELCYGAACLALAWAALRYARVLPDVALRPRRPPEYKPFG